ncbi:MAG TPA: MrpF/PhaF family protein [Acidimicrobiales bacterium]|nr:MrpF/PhaF family protein [Acidimicrobiales bacterium]
MNAWLLAAAVLIGAGLLPAGVIGSRGDAVARLVGLELAAVVATVVLMLLSQAAGQSSYLIVPMVLVVLSFAGTLVFTRLLAAPPPGEPARREQDPQ